STLASRTCRTSSARSAPSSASRRASTASARRRPADAGGGRHRGQRFPPVGWRVLHAAHGTEPVLGGVPGRSLSDLRLAARARAALSQRCARFLGAVALG